MPRLLALGSERGGTMKSIRERCETHQRQVLTWPKASGQHDTSNMNCICAALEALREDCAKIVRGMISGNFVVTTAAHETAEFYAALQYADDQISKAFR